MEKTNLDTFLSLVAINRTKQSLLSQMMNLELQNQKESKDYSNLKDYYQLTHEYYQKKLLTLSETDDILTKIKNLNPDFFNKNISEYLCNFSNTSVKRVIFDIMQEPLFDLYTENNQKQDFSILEILFGLELDNMSKNNQIEIINKFLNHDIINLIMDKIEDDIEKDNISNPKSRLLKWKYQLILLSEDLENNYLFCSQPKLQLTDYFSIRNQNLTVEEYFEIADGVCRALLKQLINFCLNDLNREEECSIYLMLIEIITEFLHNKTFCLQYLQQLDYLIPKDNSYKELLIEPIKEKMEHGIHVTKDTIEYRKYLSL